MGSVLEHVHAATQRAESTEALAPAGRLRAIVGNVVEAEGIDASTGSLYRVDREGNTPLVAETIGFHGDRSVLMPLADASGLAPGSQIRALRRGAGRAKASALMGRVVDGLARPIDGLPQAPEEPVRARSTPSSLRRRRITEPLDVGVRALNSLLTIGRGTRIGLFAAAGVGKSTLLGQIARFAKVDCFVVALVGERGREVRDFVESQLGDALGRAVVVVATSDEAPVMRRRAADLATSLAEELRDEGQEVLLLMDSLTRVCAAQREIGLAAGEPPATRGYPPSVWSALPRLLERAGTCEGRGSITGIYTVLVEGDDLDEPVADAARSLLDGHVVLSRRLAERGHHPAIDVLASVSRTMPQLVSPDAIELATRARSILSSRANVEDLISIGAYQPGNDPQADEAVRLSAGLNAFLCQASDERVDLETSRAALAQAVGSDA